MSHCKLEPLKIIKQMNKTNLGTVFFLHGSGDSGPGVLEWIEFLVGNLQFPHIKFVFPTAPRQPYTPLHGEYSNVWFDRYSITQEVAENKESIDSIGIEIKEIIQREVASGTQLNKIIIGGFSMGGALALHTAYRFLPGLGGVFALSSFLNEGSAVYKNLEVSSTFNQTPLYMSHGDYDSLVPIGWGRNTYQKLLELKVKGEFVPLKNTMHELKKQEMLNLFDWINKLIAVET